MNPVAVTSLLVAAMRAEESQRSDRLFDDPFAHALAGDAGYAALRAYRAAMGNSVPAVEVRTRWFDEALTRTVAAGIAQVAILAAGMDARTYRLDLPAATRVFEVDQPEVIAYKASVLGALGSRAPTCARVALAADLAGDWPTALCAAGFDPTVATGWVVEGLLQYLDEPTVSTLFARLDALSAPRSVLLYEVASSAMIDSPVVAPLRSMMAELGAPWTFGTDDPAGLVTARGWEAATVDLGEPGTRWGRWPFALVPVGVPGVPRSYLVEARKR
jgi:methyltransferase (TIGR00027 family)